MWHIGAACTRLSTLLRPAPPLQYLPANPTSDIVDNWSVLKRNLLSVAVPRAGASLTEVRVVTMTSASAAAAARSNMGRGKKAAAAGKTPKIKFIIDCQKPVDDNILEAKGLVSWRVGLQRQSTFRLGSRWVNHLWCWQSPHACLNIARIRYGLWEILAVFSTPVCPCPGLLVFPSPHSQC